MARQASHDWIPTHPLLPITLALACLTWVAACGSDDNTASAGGGMATGGSAGSAAAGGSGAAGGGGGHVPPTDLVCSSEVADELPIWLYPTPVGGTLRTLWVSPEGNAWAAGELGALLRYDGSSWQVQPPPKTLELDPSTIYSLWGTSESDMWAVDGWGNALHWSGSHWSPTSDDPNFHGGTIRGSGATDIWWVYDGQGAHWDGVSWSEPVDIGNSGSAGLYVASPTEAWAAGGTVVSRWNGSSWSEAYSTLMPMRHLDGSGPADLWLVGESYTHHYDGTSWQYVDEFVPEATVASVWAAAPDDTWFSLDNGKILHRTGPGAITTYDQPTGGQRFVDLGGHGASVYGVGYRGTLGRFVDGEWIIDSHGSDWSTPGAISGAGPTPWIVVGNGVGTFDDGALTEQPVAPESSTAMIRDIWVTAPDDAWAVGNGVLHFDGTIWSDMLIAENDMPLFAVWARSSDDVWAVGAQGTVVHYDGNDWSLEPFPSADDLDFVAGLPDGQVVIGGADGPLVVLRDDEWVDLSDDPVFEGEPGVVDAASDGQYVWIVEEYGRITVYDGQDLLPSANCGLDHGRFSHVSVGADGTVWFAGRDELLRVGPAAVESVASTLLEPESVWSGTDGRVWIATSFGLQTVAE